MEVRYLSLRVAFASVLCLCQSYILRGGSVSWVAPASSDAAEDADLSEEDAPALLVDSAGLWKQTYSSPGVLGDSVESPAERAESENDNVAQLSSRLFSYRLEKVQKPTTSSSSRSSPSLPPPPPPPPPHTETARTSRYIAHYSDWAHLATISTQDEIKGLPFGSIFSVSDGPPDNSTGVIYFYVTPMDNSVSDLRSNPHASLTFSEAEGQFCRQMGFDPEDPRCGRLTLTGKMVVVAPEEVAFAKEAMFSRYFMVYCNREEPSNMEDVSAGLYRHPVMAKWPVGHKWFFMKLELIQVWLQDWVGGRSLVPLDDYFQATPF